MASFVPVAKPASCQLRLSHPLAQGLVGAWFFTEGSKWANDSSPYQNNTVGFKGGVGPTVSAGQNGYALFFSSATSLNLNTSSVLQLLGTVPTLSVTALMKPVTVGVGGRIISLDDGVNGWCINLESSGTNQLAYQVFNAGATENGSAVNFYAFNVWTQIAVTVSPTTVTFYANGAFFSSTAVSGPSATFTGTASLGNRSAGADRIFDGTLDHVTVYNRVLSANEISRLAQDPYAIIRPRRAQIPAVSKIPFSGSVLTNVTYRTVTVAY